MLFERGFVNYQLLSLNLSVRKQQSPNDGIHCGQTTHGKPVSNFVEPF